MSNHETGGTGGEGESWQPGAGPGAAGELTYSTGPVQVAEAMCVNNICLLSGTYMQNQADNNNFLEACMILVNCRALQHPPRWVMQRWTVDRLYEEAKRAMASINAASQAQPLIREVQDIAAAVAEQPLEGESADGE
jgi:hypothetical protein